MSIVVVIGPMRELCQVRGTSDFDHVAVVLDLKVPPQAFRSNEGQQDHICIHASHEDADHFAVCVALRLLLIDDRLG